MNNNAESETSNLHIQIGFRELTRAELGNGQEYDDDDGNGGWKEVL